MFALQILITGQVQGVGYRYWASRTAYAANVSGWVRNLVDGRVEIWAEGTEDDVMSLVRDCQRGPKAAKVESVVHHTVTPRQMEGFVMVSTATAPEPVE